MAEAWFRVELQGEYEDLEAVLEALFAACEDQHAHICSDLHRDDELEQKYQAQRAYWESDRKPAHELFTQEGDACTRVHTSLLGYGSDRYGRPLTLGELTSMTRKELLGITGIGATCLGLIEDILLQYDGRSLRPDP